MTDFEEALSRSREREKAFARWLGRWAYVLPVYDFSGHGESKAPKLSGAREGLVCPDFLVSHDGLTVWVELKHKRSSWSGLGYPETGMSLRLWDQYRRVQDATGISVYVVFAHVAEDKITWDPIHTLESLPSKRIYKGDRFAHMVFWRLEELKMIKRYTEVFR